MKLDGFIEAEKHAGRSIARCCRLFEVSRAAYYQRCNPRPSPRQSSDAVLSERIQAIHDVSAGTYGTPRVTAELRQEGEAVGRRRVGRLMRRAGLEGRAKKRWRHALDLGCGYGPVALTLAHRAPQATVWAIDVNERAVELCRANAAALGSTTVHASVVSDDRPTGEVPDDVRFDLVWSNPPIRIGKTALHALLTRWLDRLTPDGRAWLVVQRNLGADSLQRWLEAEGRPAERVASRAGYRLLSVRPRDGA